VAENPRRARGAAPSVSDDAAIPPGAAAANVTSTGDHSPVSPEHESAWVVTGDPSWRSRTGHRSCSSRAAAALKYYRRAREWSVSEAARQSGVSRRMIGMLERAQRRPSPKFPGPRRARGGCLRKRVAI